MRKNLPTNDDVERPEPVDTAESERPILPLLRKATVHGGDLIDAVAVWQQRDSEKAQPEVTAAGHDAVTAVDGMLAGLNRLRSQLVSEIREHQDASARRTDALLERLQREQRDGGDGS